jgi:hypothetical protein
MNFGGDDLMVATTAGTLSDLEHSKQLRRAVVASTVGTAIEWYDFFLYGTVAALVFPKLYFPNTDPMSALLLSFTTYAVGFAARPVGPRSSVTMATASGARRHSSQP